VDIGCVARTCFGTVLSCSVHGRRRSWLYIMTKRVANEQFCRLVMLQGTERRCDVTRPRPLVTLSRRSLRVWYSEGVDYGRRGRVYADRHPSVSEPPALYTETIAGPPASHATCRPATRCCFSPERSQSPVAGRQLKRLLLSRRVSG